MRAINTQGDNDNLACPKCGRYNHHVCREAPAVGNSKRFLYNCTYCHAKLIIWASWKVCLTASIETKSTDALPE